MSSRSPGRRGRWRGHQLDRVASRGKYLRPPLAPEFPLLTHLEASLAKPLECGLEVRCHHGNMAPQRHNGFRVSHQVDLGSLPLQPGVASVYTRWQRYLDEPDRLPEMALFSEEMRGCLESDVMDHVRSVSAGNHQGKSPSQKIRTQAAAPTTTIAVVYMTASAVVRRSSP